MPALQPIEQFEFGGVDSRSNALNMPPDRALYMRNWCPRPDGHLELRYGYSLVAMSVVVVDGIHSLIPYQSWDTTKKYLLVGQTANLRIHDLASGTESAPVVKGSAIVSGADWGYYQANNRIHIGNGTDQKFFDGVNLWDNGLRAPTATDVISAVVSPGVAEISSVDAAAVGLAEGGGGTFVNTTLGGFLIFVAFFDPTLNEIGPATINVGSGRLTVTAGPGRSLNLTNLPVTTTQRKLVGRTVDGGNQAFFAYNTSTVISSSVRSGTTLTVTSAAHGLTTGEIVILASTINFDGVYSVTVTGVNTFTVVLQSATGANTSSGAARRIVQAAPAGTTASINTLANLNLDYVVNQDRGLPASVAENQPGYQFYGAIYNPTTGHVGNRTAIGGRLQLTQRSNVHIIGLPDYSAGVAEQTMLIGRTGDGAIVPYAVIDSGGNFISLLPGATSIVITDSSIDGNYELPTRNGQIPAICTMFARVGTRSYAADPNSPTIRASADEADVAQGKFLGRPEQSWAPNDIDTFPTAEPISGIAEVDYELFIGTRNDTAVFTDMNGQFVWRGPWNVGLAGPRAMAKAMPYGFFWLSGDKQLCSFQSGIPSPVSDEYEQAELLRIGDAFLSGVELRYFRDVHSHKDELRIECRDLNGLPFTVIHDFKLRDGRSPEGQAYSAVFSGPLGISFTSVEARDANGRRRIYAGASTGRLYQLYADSDDAGNSFSADGVYLLEAGSRRLNVPVLDWFGDETVAVSIGRTLSTVMGTGTPAFVPLGEGASVQDEQDDPRWRVENPSPEVKSHIYLRFQLDSHSADGNLALNSPPHVPLETYGRIWELVPQLGPGRDL